MSKFLHNRQLLALLITLFVGVGTARATYVPDFTAVVPSGQTLCFDIISSTDHTVGIVSPLSYGQHYGPNNPAPVGDLVIPSTVSYNGETYTVTALLNNHHVGALQETGLTSVVVPATVNNVQAAAFYQSSSLTMIICYATTPPSSSGGGYQYDTWATFSGLSENCVLYVPEVSLESYQADNYWNRLPIQAIEGLPQYSVIEGAINGLFSVNDTTLVRFSKGNLQYQASTETWRFAENQWDYVGEENSNISQTYSGWIDLFGWGTSGWDSGNQNYHPWNSSNAMNEWTYYGPNGLFDLTGQYANADWGVYNPISNGGNQPNLWRTMTKAEWNYVFQQRNTPSGIRYAKAVVNEVAGTILLPDDWDADYYSLNNTNTANSAFASNEITVDDWTSILEPHGAVFLPNSGARTGTSLILLNTRGSYWSTSYYDGNSGSSFFTGADCAYAMYLYDNTIEVSYNHRCDGLAVRLVSDTQGLSVQATPNIPEGGSVMGGGLYQPGSICTLTAVANAGYTFVNWSENDVVVSSDATYSFTVTGNRNLVANFEVSNIVFADSTAKAICVAHWDTDGDGELSYVEAAAVTDIGVVFKNNKSITSFEELQYFSGLTSLGQYAFGWCSQLASIVIPNTVTNIDAAFYACSSLESIIIPESLVSVSSYAFSGCDVLESIIVEEGNQVYDSRDNCNAIIRTSDNELVQGSISTIIPNTVTSIGWLAFSSMSGLTSIFIPASVTSISYNSFYACDGLQQIIVAEENPVYDSRGNCNAIIETNTNKLVAGCKNTVIPNTVTSIGTYAFSYRFNGEDTYSVVIPNSVSVTEDRAFLGCRSMVSLVISSAMTSIGDYCFRECWSLASVTVLAAEPPVLGTQTFDEVNKSIPVYVPCGSLEAYQNAEGWSEFTDIIEVCHVTITANPNPAEGGAVIGAGSFEEGQTCTLTATANEGYTFINWTENNEVVSIEATYSFTTDVSRSLMANFAANSIVPAGALNGIFTISENQQVYFSKGNLQYQASSNTWRFAENPWEYIGNGNLNVSPTYSGWIDLFHWGTSGYDHGAVSYQPYSTSTSSNNYYAYGKSNYSLNDSTGMADWGYNPISNGGNQENLWRVLTNNEWHFVLFQRQTTSGIRYARARVNGVNGLIILPDDWDASYYALNNTNSSGASYSNNTISSADWVGYLHSHGAAFLPCAGNRSGNYMYNTANGDYWSSTRKMDGDFAYDMCIQSGSVGNSPSNGSLAQSVRLVRSTTSTITTYSIEAVPNPAEGGTITGTATYMEGTTCTLIATANEGYNFVNWTEDGMEVSNEATYSFLVTGGRSLEVNFVVQSDVPTGALAGLYSVSGNQQIYFSKGNLQYQASTNTWKFADNQWDYVGEDNANVSPTYDGWIDLFVFGTSGYNHGAVCYQPWSTELGNSELYNPYGGYYNLYDQDGRADWGYNAISNGGNQEGIWHTPSAAEWNYILNIRNTPSGIRYAQATVNEVQGLIICPDNWSSNYYSLSNTNQAVDFSSNVISSGDWNACFELHGAVFLPLTGFRADTIYYEQNTKYHTSNGNDHVAQESVVRLYQYNIDFQSTWHDNAFAVRLIRPSSEIVSYSIQGTSNPFEGGAVTGSGSYVEGVTCTLTATANVGYTFVNWTENEEQVSTDATYSFSVTADRTLVANFEEVTGENYWTPNGSDFEDNMTLTGVIQIDGVEQQSTMLELGAFVGNDCRGSQRATFFEPTQRYIVQIIVFGETGEQITFKLYDHGTQQELDLTSPSPVTFNSNGYGSLVNPYVLNFTSSVTHFQPLTNGWNWWSTYIELEGNDGLAQLENSLGENGVMIKSRANGYVESYSYNNTMGWYGTLSSIVNEQMYKVRTNGACTSEITGMAAVASAHPVAINPGWNWIGYPVAQATNVSTAMSGFTPEPDDVIKGRNSYTTYFSDGTVSMWYGTLNSFEPGQGYMYQSNSSTSKTLTFQSGRGEMLTDNVTAEDNIYRPMTEEYADNMTLTAVVEREGEELRSGDYEVAVFAGDECRGSAKLMYVAPVDKYIAFLSVFGLPGEELTFQLTDGIESSQGIDRIVFTADGTFGTLRSPKVLRFNTLGVDDDAAKVLVYPNPTEGVFKVEADGLQRVELHNALGQTVLSKEIEGSNVEIDLSAHASGVYLLRVVTNNGVVNQQIIKK